MVKQKEVALPVRVAEETAHLLKQIAANRPLTPRIRRKLSQAAAELDVRIGLANDGQVKVPNKLVIVMLRGITILVHFRKEIKEAASALMSIGTK